MQWTAETGTSGPEIGLPGRILAGLLPGEDRDRPSDRPSAGRRADFGAFPKGEGRLDPQNQVLRKVSQWIGSLPGALLDKKNSKNERIWKAPGPGPSGQILLKDQTRETRLRFIFEADEPGVLHTVASPTLCKKPLEKQSYPAFRF